jgi:hypothetical protein
MNDFETIVILSLFMRLSKKTFGFFMFLDQPSFSHHPLKKGNVYCSNLKSHFSLNSSYLGLEYLPRISFDFKSTLIGRLEQSKVPMNNLQTHFCIQNWMCQ